MESNGNFESVDHVEVFGQSPKRNRIEPGTLRLTYVVGVGLLATVCLLFMMYLGTIMIIRDTCLTTHISEKTGEYRSLPHERDEQGCIRDFKHPIGYNK